MNDSNDSGQPNNKKLLVGIAAFVVMALLVALSLNTGAPQQKVAAPTKPKVPPTMTFFDCDGNSGILYNDQVLLKLAKKKDGSFADFGSDPVYDGQAFEIMKNYYIEKQPDPLPETKQEFESDMRSLKVYEANFNEGSSGSVVEFGSDELSLPIGRFGNDLLGPLWTLNRETLELSYVWRGDWGVYKGTAQCSVTDKELWLARLEEYRVKLEEYRARVEAANPGDTRKI